MKSDQESSTTSSGRRYDGSRRRDDARRRKLRVVEAARRLFLEQGYGATSIEQIAKEAEVSVQNVYATFDGKAGLLKAVVDITVGGDDEEIMRRDRPDFVAMVAEPDPVVRLRTVAHMARLDHARSAAILRVVNGVAGADPAVGALAADLVRQLREDSLALTRSFPEGARRQGWTDQELADMGLVVGSPSTYSMLVEDFGWSEERYEDWLFDALRRLTFAD